MGQDRGESGPPGPNQLILCFPFFVLVACVVGIIIFEATLLPFSIMY